MGRNTPRISRLGQLALALPVISLLCLVAWIGHSVATGTVMPERDPTPERIEFIKFHDKIDRPLLAGFVYSFAASVLVVTAWAGRWLFRILARSLAPRSD